MHLRKIISLLLLLLLTVQLYPAQQTGGACCTGNWMEELTHQHDGGTCRAHTASEPGFMPCELLECTYTAGSRRTGSFFNRGVKTPPNPVYEMHCPPPNRQGSNL